MTYLVADIERAVCLKYSLSKEVLRSQTWVRAVARPRQILMYLSRQMTKASLPHIGRYLGGRDHTTILYGNRRITQMLRETNTMAGEVEGVREIVLRLTPEKQRLAAAAANPLVIAP
jgi:chromosomal replication initiator protein